MIKVSTTGMAVSLKTDLRFPIPEQQGHGDRIIQQLNQLMKKRDEMRNKELLQAIEYSSRSFEEVMDFLGTDDFQD